MTKAEQQEYDHLVMAEMKKARSIAGKLFGSEANIYAIHEIYDYLQVVVNEEKFARDLKQMIAMAKEVYEIQEPSPEMVFGLFERVFEDEDEEENEEENEDDDDK